MDVWLFSWLTWWCNEWELQETSKICHIEITSFCIKTGCVCVCVISQGQALHYLQTSWNRLWQDSVTVSLGGKVCLHCLSQVGKSNFCCKPGKSAAETLVSLKMVSDNQTLKNPLCTTDNQFKNGQESLESKECSDKSEMSTNKETVLNIHAVKTSDYCATALATADKTVGYQSAHSCSIPQNAVRGRTIKFVNSPPCTCRGCTGKKP